MCKATKAYFDKKKSTKGILVKVGDLVMVKLPGAKVRFSAPIRVVKVFKNAVRTQDHRVWNLSRIALYSGTSPVGINVTPSSSDPGHSSGRPLRKIKRPGYLKDYVE